MESNNDVFHFDIAQVKKRFTRDPLVTNVSVLKSHVHRAAFNLRSFSTRVSSSFFFIEGHDVFFHFDIAQVKTNFTREPLVTKVPLVNLTVACVPVQHRARSI